MTGLAGSGSLWAGVRLGVIQHSQQPKNTAQERGGGGERDGEVEKAGGRRKRSVRGI